MFPDSRLTRTEFYDGFLAPQGLFYGVGLVFQKQPQRSIRITSARAMSRGGFESAEQVLLRRLGPHLNRAFTIQEKLGCFVERSQAFAEVVARLPISVLLLDDRGEVLFANRRAEELLRRRDGLALDAAARTLVAIGREDTSRLRRLIHQAAQTSSASGEEAAGSVLLRREASGRPLHTLVLPLKAHHYYVGRRPAAVGVLVSELDQRLELSAEHARSLYDLTPAESRLASWLLSGRRLKDVADELHVSLHTVRAQLKSVFSKTGTNRQGELIRLLALGPGLIADRDHDSRKA
jgi:DNA-binding CsgD family transcriptional regulator